MGNWENALITPNATLEEAVSTINSSALRIAIVVDANRKLIGTVTDGDIRRSLLRHVPLSSPVMNVVCTKPKVAKRSWAYIRMLSVLENSNLLHLPIVDDDGIIVGLETIHGLLEKRTFSNPVFLMAGGFGTRLHPLTQNCPKPLLKVGGKSILELTLEAFINSGFNRFFISTHYLPEMVKDYFGDGTRWGVSIRYTYEEEPLGTGGALGLLPHEEINESLLLMNGDLLTTLNFKELMQFHSDRQSVATMCVREYENQIPFGVIKGSGEFVEEMIEKPVQKYLINAGIYLLAPALVKSVRRGTKIDMTTLLAQEIQRGKKVAMFPVHEYWRDIGRIEDLNRAQSEFMSSFKM